jgi:transposase-like protein
MKQYIQITCPYCQHDDLVKNGHSENGTQRYRCKACCLSLLKKRIFGLLR